MKFIINIFITISKWIDKAPFSGKVAIRPMVLSVYSDTSDKKTKKAVKAIILLIVMIAGHFLQSYIGLDIYNEKEFMAFRVIGLIYALVNYAVVYTQFVILIRLIGHLYRYAKKNRVVCEKHAKFFTDYSGSYAFRCFIVTLLGQAIVITVSCL